MHDNYVKVGQISFCNKILFIMIVLDILLNLPRHDKIRVFCINAKKTYKKPTGRTIGPRY